MTDLTPAPFVSPMALVAEATRSGNLELVRELLALKREHEQDEARKAFNAGLAAACGELPSIAKGKLVDFQSSKGRVRYRHATLASILDQVRPVLAKHRLFVSFDLEEDGNVLRVGCRIRHDGGHERVTWLSGPRDESGTKNVIQSKGSTVTYLERYTLCAALGIAATDDDDGQAAGPPVGGTRAAPSVAATTPIGTRDVAGIRALCGELSDPRAIVKILAFAQADELEDITVDQLPMILEWLRKKKEAEVAAAEVEQALEDELVEEFGPIAGEEGSNEQA